MDGRETLLDAADELVKNVVGAFLCRHSGHFFCIGCLTRQVNTGLGRSFSSAEIHRVVDAMFRSTQNKSGPFQQLPSYPCYSHGRTDLCIGVPADRAQPSASS